MSLTTRETIGNNLKPKFIGHMKANGIIVPTTKLGDYFAPTGRMKLRNTKPELKMSYEEDINLTGMIGGNELPEEMTWISQCEGELDLSNNAFTTLEGCPEVVLGNVSINGNGKNLLLLGFPKQVGSDKIESNIELINSQITGLKYLPRTTNGSLRMNNCRLTSLEDCPQTINGNFEIDDNSLITNLQDGPKFVKGYYKCYSTSIEDFVHAPINPDFKGFIMPPTIGTADNVFRYVSSWAGFKPAMDDQITNNLITYIEERYQTYLKNPISFSNNETRFVMKLGAYLEIRKSKPELDTSIEAREEYMAYKPTSLEDFKAKSDTKQYEGVDINYIKMLKKALLK